jgi:Zn-dependent peptidase ImmA (M78 family)
MSVTITAEPSKWIRAYQLRPPIDVKKMADDLGVKIWELTDMPPDASGKLFPDRRSTSGFSIGVNRHDSYTRKRFSIAHELAHFLLHRSEVQDGIIDDTFYRSEHLSGAQETEANKFAADILMPYDLINSMAQRGITDVDELAKTFGVSTQAMSIRLGIPLP